MYCTCLNMTWNYQISLYFENFCYNTEFPLSFIVFNFSSQYSFCLFLFITHAVHIDFPTRKKEHYFSLSDSIGTFVFTHKYSSEVIFVSNPFMDANFCFFSLLLEISGWPPSKRNKWAFPWIHIHINSDIDYQRDRSCSFLKLTFVIYGRFVFVCSRFWITNVIL